MSDWLYNWWWTCNATTCPNQVTALLISSTIAAIGILILLIHYDDKYKGRRRK